MIFSKQDNYVLITLHRKNTKIDSQIRSNHENIFNGSRVIRNLSLQIDSIFWTFFLENCQKQWTQKLLIFNWNFIHIYHRLRFQMAKYSSICFLIFWKKFTNIHEDLTSCKWSWNVSVCFQNNDALVPVYSKLSILKLTVKKNEWINL